MSIFTYGTKDWKLIIASIFLISIIISSCSTPKNITYFNDVSDTVQKRLVDQATYTTPAIQPDDILQVTIQTMDPSSTSMLNQQNISSWPAGGTTNAGNSSVPVPGLSTNPANVSGYVVDKNGFVVLPLIGKVQVAGMTTDKVRDEITAKATEFYKDPIVSVRFANFKVTVLGEVTRPSTYIMPNEKVTLLDAISMAGDLTIFGKRENVLLIRDAGANKKEFVRFNLNDSKIFSSPYFYLHQGDVVYIEPNKSKVSSTDMAQTRRISIYASVLSVLIVIATRIKF
jgi:polysaccharide export outer membrane protein